MFRAAVSLLPDTDLFSKLGLEAFVQLCCLQWFCYKVIFADNELEFYYFS